MNLRTTAFAGIIIALTSLTGCGGGGSTFGVVDPDVKFVNALSDGASVDFYINDSLQYAGVAAGTSITGFKTYEFVSEGDGGYDVSVNVAGNSNDLERDVQVFGQNSHTIGLLFGLSDPAADQDKRAQQDFFTVDRRSPNGLKSRLLIYNALQQDNGVENQAINFQSFDPSDPASETNPQYRRSNLSYGMFDAGANALDIDAGTFTFQARQSGTDGLEVFASSTRAFVAGKTYLAVVRGQVGSATNAPTINFIEIEPQ